MSGPDGDEATRAGVLLRRNRSEPTPPPIASPEASAPRGLFSERPFRELELRQAAKFLAGTCPRNICLQWPDGRAKVTLRMSRKTRLLRDDDLRELLVSRGMRVTEQRMVILRELAKLRIPTSHPELTERLSGADLDRATIYRNLLSLTEAGLLVKTQLGDNVWRFELPQSTSAEHGTHPHFVCSDCGSVACLPANSVALRGEAAQNEVADVQLRGRCAGCVRA